MTDIPTWHSLIGLVGIFVWGILCGVPALAIYSLAARTHSGWSPWVLMIALLLVWFPLVTVLCVWAVSMVIGLRIG